MKFLFLGLFVSCLTLTGCSQTDQETEEMAKIVQLEEENGLIRE